MKTRLENLKKINELKGATQNVINVEADGRYNNPIYSGAGKTPFQPGTQCAYTVVENVTSDKQIVALATPNKLCQACALSGTKREKNMEITKAIAQQRYQQTKR